MRRVVALTVPMVNECCAIRARLDDVQILASPAPGNRCLVLAHHAAIDLLHGVWCLSSGAARLRAAVQSRVGQQRVHAPTIQVDAYDITVRS